MKRYYYLHEGAPVGVFTIEQLHELAHKDALQPSTLICEEGTEQWIPLASILQASLMPFATAIKVLDIVTVAMVLAAIAYAFLSENDIAAVIAVSLFAFAGIPYSLAYYLRNKHKKG